MATWTELVPLFFFVSCSAAILVELNSSFFDLVGSVFGNVE